MIYELIEDKYCSDNGRPSIDPVILIKIPFIQYLYGIRSMRQTFTFSFFNRITFFNKVTKCYLDT